MPMICRMFNSLKIFLSNYLPTLGKIKLNSGKIWQELLYKMVELSRASMAKPKIGDFRCDAVGDCSASPKWNS